MRIRYTRWTGGQDPFGRDVSADDVIDELADDLFAGADPQEALRGLLRRGMSGRVAGLSDLRRRVEEARRRELARMGLDGPLQRVAEELAEIVAMEQAALELADLADAPEAVDGARELPRARRTGPAASPAAHRARQPDRCPRGLRLRRRAGRRGLP